MEPNYNEIIADYDGVIKEKTTSLSQLEIHCKEIQQRIANGKEVLELMKKNREYFASLIAVYSPNHFPVAEPDLSPFPKGLILDHNELQNTAYLKQVEICASYYNSPILQEKGQESETQFLYRSWYRVILFKFFNN